MTRSGRMIRGFDLQFRSLQTKLLLGTLFVLVLIMASVMAVIEELQRGAIVSEVQRRGEVLARSLAATSTGPLLLYNFTALEQNVAQVAREADVVYAMILDADGKIVAHSGRPELVGSVLKGPVPERAAEATQLLVQESRQRKSGEALYDIAFPVYIEGQKWGTARLGLSRRRMDVQIRRARWELAGLSLTTLLIGGLGAAFVARRIARPVRQLAAGAEAIARGELDQQIEPAGADEIGQLALTFNHMAAQLRAHQSEIESANAELRCRFEEVAELKNYTDSILGSVTSGIATLDLDGRVATLNPAAEMLTGLFAPEVAGRYCLEVFAHSPDLGELLMETLERRSGVANVSLTLRRPNGTTLPIEMSTAPLRGREGKDLGVVGVFRDVTVLRELEEQVRRSDRWPPSAPSPPGSPTRSRIRSPRFARSRDSCLESSTTSGSASASSAWCRTSSSASTPSWSSSSSWLARRGSSFQPVRLAELIDRTLDLYADQIEGKRVDDPARIRPRLRADPGRSRVSLSGLREPGGQRPRRDGDGWAPHAPGGLEPGGRSARPPRPGAPGRYVKVEIEDTGKGISWSEADKVFNPFFTTKASGTGLGLALTHKIVEDHRGRISLRSVPGKGTTFRVILPETALAGHSPERSVNG